MNLLKSLMLLVEKATDHSTMGWNNLSEQARNVFYDAAKLSATGGRNTVDINHLLIAILSQEQSSALMIVSRLGVNVENLKKEIGAHLQEESRTGPDSKIPKLTLTKASRKATKEALSIAKAAGRNWVGSHDLLLGILRFACPDTVELLKKYALTQETVEFEVAQMENPKVLEESTDNNEGGSKPE